MLPASCGGLGLPDIRVYALATMPDLPELQAYGEVVVRNEEDHLRHILQPPLPIALEEVAGNILQMPAGKGAKQLAQQKRCARFITTVSEMRGEDEVFSSRSQSLRYGWLRISNLIRDDPDKPEGFSGQGGWLRALPTTKATTTPDRAYRWGLQQRLGQDAPLTGQRCGKPTARWSWPTLSPRGGSRPWWSRTDPWTKPGQGLHRADVYLIDQQARPAVAGRRKSCAWRTFAECQALLHDDGVAG